MAVAGRAAIRTILRKVGATVLSCLSYILIAFAILVVVFRAGNRVIGIAFCCRIFIYNRSFIMVLAG